MNKVESLLSNEEIQNGIEINPTIVSVTAKLITNRFVLVLSLRAPLKYAKMTSRLTKITIIEIKHNEAISQTDG